MDRVKVMTVLGTRPEIIRLSSTIKLLDRYTDHILVHTGQNYDYNLNEVFFKDFGLRSPDYFLDADAGTLGSTLGSIISKVEQVIVRERPDAFLVLGDTNSCISALIAKRLQIPVFHMEAGNRCFDENVPEETNRRLVDHVSDYNLVYTEHARRNLLSEGVDCSKVLLVGSPMREVLNDNYDKILASNVMTELGLNEGGFFLVSLHRQENVDCSSRLSSALEAMVTLRQRFGVPVVISTHPRMEDRLKSQPVGVKEGLTFCRPFGFHDYVRLELAAKVVLSDSGTVSEESSILGFPAVTLRDAIERPEAVEAGSIVTCGVDVSSVVQSVEMVVSQRWAPSCPAEYEIGDTSSRVLKAIFSFAHSHIWRARLRL